MNLPKPPADPETLIRFECQIEIHNTVAWHQVWWWGMIQAHSVIFPSTSVATMQDSDLQQIIIDSGLAQANSRFTFKRDSDWVFVNFNFEDLSD